jgi:hypothetical protein
MDELHKLSKKIKKDKKDKKKKDKNQSDDEDMIQKSAKKEDKKIYKNSFRTYTLSMVVPASIIDNAQSMELKTYLVG